MVPSLLLQIILAVIILCCFKLLLTNLLKQWELVLSLYGNQMVVLLGLINLLLLIRVLMLCVKQCKFELVRITMKLHILRVLMKMLSGSLSLLPLPIIINLLYLHSPILKLLIPKLMLMIALLLKCYPLFALLLHVLKAVAMLIAIGFFCMMLIMVICRLRLPRHHFLWLLALNLVKAMRKIFFVLMDNIRVVLLLNSLLDALLHMPMLSVIQLFFTLLIAVCLFISMLLEVDGLRRFGAV